MTGERRLYLDAAPGEARGVVTLDGRPERLLIEREGDDAPRLGARYRGCVTAVSPRLGLARVNLGETVGSLRLRGDSPLHEGEGLELEVLAEAQGGKPPLLRRLGPAAGPPGSSAPPPPLRTRLAMFAPDQAIVEAEEAREIADEAEEAALARRHDLGGGLSLTIEPTRALTAVDVDLAEDAAPGGILRRNLAAVGEAARLLRLKGQGGLAVIDLIGFPTERARLLAAARAAFAADGPEAVVGALGRFGTLEVSRPRAAQPIAERLLDSDGEPTPRTRAQRLLRALQREGRADPGARLALFAAPELARLLAPLVARLGPRFQVREEVGRKLSSPDIRSL